MIAGESLDPLVRAVVLFRFRRNPSGTYRVDGTLPSALADPFLRALDRVEKELHQIDLEGGHGAMDRTPEQRRADAFLDLIERVVDASDTQHH